MPAVDIAPLMNTGVWKSWDPATRQEAKNIWLDKDTSDADRAEMLQLAQKASERLRLGELEAHLAQLEGQAAPQPTPRTRLEELEAELARRDTPQATGGTYTDADVQNAMKTLQRPQEPAEEPITPERRFLDLPSSQQMSLEDRTQRFQEFYRLKPELKEEFLRSEEPPSDLVVDIEKPSPPAPTGWRANLPQTPEEWDRRMAPMKQTAEDTSANAIPMALNMVPGMAGYNLGLKIAPKLGAIGKAVPPALEALGGYAGHRANVKLGYEKEGPLGDVLSALPLAVRALGSGTAGWLERTIKDAPVAARDQTMDLLSKLFSRGGAQGTLTYLLSGDPQLAAWVGGSYATVRSLLGFALRSDIGKQLVEATLKAGRAIGGAELGMLLQIGRTGKAPVPAQEQDLASSSTP